MFNKWIANKMKNFWKTVRRLIHKLALVLGYLGLVVTIVVVPLVLYDKYGGDERASQTADSSVKLPEVKTVDEVLSFQTVASNPECASEDELLFMCSFIEKTPASISSVYICRKDKDVVLNIYRSSLNDLTSLESSIEDSFVPWTGVGKGIVASFEFNDQGAVVEVGWGLDDRGSSGSDPSAWVYGAFDGFGACNDIQHYPGFYFPEDLE
jgi:hypothetical protein